MMTSLDAFKLDATFFDNGVAHSRTDRPDEFWADISILGKGGQGTVYLQQLQSGPTRLLRAVKELSPDPQKGHMMRELNTMLAVRDHEELFVILFGWFEDPRGTVFLAMEYVPHGDLAAYIQATPAAQRDARGVTEQLLMGLSVLHSLHICHRDLKPQNVLLTALNPIKVKLADFGISKSTAGTDLRTRVGTAHYMAPEQLGLLPARLRLASEYTTAVDMWALGFIVHELLTGRTPFLETSPAENMSSGYPTVETGAVTVDMRLMLLFCDGYTALPLEPLRTTEPDAVRFIGTLVVPDPRSRASAVQALLDPWITGQILPLAEEHDWRTDHPRAEQLYYSGGYVVPAPLFNPWTAQQSSSKPKQSVPTPLVYPIGRFIKPPGAPRVKPASIFYDLGSPTIARTLVVGPPPVQPTPSPRRSTSRPTMGSISDNRRRGAMSGPSSHETTTAWATAPAWSMMEGVESVDDETIDDSPLLRILPDITPKTGTMEALKSNSSLRERRTDTPAPFDRGSSEDY